MLRALILLALVASLAPDGKVYYIAEYKVTLEVLDGGDINVTEQITFAFVEGRFTYAYRAIPLRKLSGIVFYGVYSAGEPVEYSFHKGLTEARVEWRYPPVEASGQPVLKTFTLAYLAVGAIREDDGRLLVDYQAVGKGWRVPIESVEIRVVLPPGVAPSEVEVHPDAAPDCMVTAREGRVIAVFRYPRLAPGEGYRVVLWFPEVITVRRELDVVSAIGAACTLGALAATAALVAKRMREHRLPSEPAVEPPLSPAEAAILVSRVITPLHFAVALFELALRGLVKIEVKLSMAGRILRYKKTELKVYLTREGREALYAGRLQEHERAILAELAEPADKRKLARVARKADELLKPLRRKLIEEGYASESYFKVRRWAVALLILSIASMSIGVALGGYLARPPLLLSGIASGIPLAAASALNIYRPPRGQTATLVAQAKAYSRELRRQAEELAESMPAQALKLISDKLPWLLVSTPHSWLNKVLKRIKQVEEVPIPGYMTIEMTEDFKQAYAAV
ncbi:MAG: hypothetical protein DRN99_09160, partial [Thermoproteota archaeon]